MSWESFPFLVPCKNVCRMVSSFCPSIHGLKISFLKKKNIFSVLSFQIFHDSQHDFMIFHDSQQLHETQD